MVLVLLVAGCGEDERSATPSTVPPLGAGGLAIGIHEQNPNFVWSRAARPEPAGGFAPWRDRLEALRPAIVRTFVLWDKAQPRADVPPNLAQPDAGCLRDKPPCAPYGGVRERFRAIASLRRATGGAEPLIVLTGTPSWAAAAPGGCDPRADLPDARAPREDALAAYRRFVGAVLDEAHRAGIERVSLSPWNEPNHPASLAPQRARCAVDAPPLGAVAYARLVRAARASITTRGGRDRLVVGELAGYQRPRPTAAGAVEFIDALPRDVVCAADVWTQHAYVGRSDRDAQDASYAGDADLRGSEGLLANVEQALDARRCPRRHRIWITETGVGGSTAGKPRPTDAASLAAGCRDMDRALRTWDADPRVDVAVQYTFREDDGFPVGLVDQSLTRSYPTYDLWRAWGERAPDAPPPPLPASCRG